MDNSNDNNDLQAVIQVMQQQLNEIYNYLIPDKPNEKDKDIIRRQLIEKEKKKIIKKAIDRSSKKHS